MMKVYFDNAATTPVDPAVLETVIPIMQEDYGNPSSVHAFGRKARALIEQSRKSVAEKLGVTPGEIFFTSGGTEADNMAIACAVRDLGVKTIITSEIEHHAILHTAEEQARTQGVNLEFVRVQSNGYVDLEHLEQLLQTHPQSLVTLMHANNEIGNLIPIERVGDLCQQYGAVFHCDTVQSIGHLPLNLAEAGVDFATCSAHKLHGLKGTGFLYANSNRKIQPLICGGSQERNMRGGTENIYGIVALSKAVELAYDHLEEDIQHIVQLKQHFMEELEARIPGVAYNGDPKGEALCTILNVQLPPTDKAEMLLFQLDIAGIAASSGSACTSGTAVGSHVLKGIGADLNRPSIRFSFSKMNNKEEVDYCVQQLAQIFES